MKLTIRPMEFGENSYWLRMRKALFPDCDDAMHSFEMGRHLPKGDAAAVLFAIDENASVSGFIELTIRERMEHSREEYVGYVEAWYIEPSARGMGLGRALMHAAEDWTRAQGLVELASDTDLDNADGLAAHLALGFEEKERVVRFIKRLE